MKRLLNRLFYWLWNLTHAHDWLYKAGDFTWGTNDSVRAAHTSRRCQHPDCQRVEYFVDHA